MAVTNCARIVNLPVFERLANDQLPHATSEPLRHAEFLFRRKRNIYTVFNLKLKWVQCFARFLSSPRDLEVIVTRP